MQSIAEILSALDNWRHLPAYQLERRVDVLFGMILPSVAPALFDFPRCGDVTVIPEFPLHKGATGISGDRSDNHSVNVDFAVFWSSKHAKRMILVELKTDPKSINDHQLCNMLEARCAGPEKILLGVKEAASASKETNKYAQLIWHLDQVGCFGNSEQRDWENPKRIFEELVVAHGWRTLHPDVASITPKGMDEITRGKFPDMHCVCFRRLADLIERTRHPMETVFSYYLRKWANQEAGIVTPWKESRVCEAPSVCRDHV